MDASHSRESTPDLYTGQGESAGYVALDSPLRDGPDKETIDRSFQKNGAPERILEERQPTNSKHTEPIGKMNDTQPAFPLDGTTKRKRSLDDLGQADENSEAQQLPQGVISGPHSKRVKSGTTAIDLSKYVSTPCGERLYGLTIPLWQRVFTFLPPIPLARMLRVNKAFNLLLDTSIDVKSTRRSVGIKTLDETEPNHIWERSHGLFARGLPLPFQGQKELQMWRLIKGKRCQECGLQKSLATDSTSMSPFQAGPGRDCTRVIWPFGKRLCGDCLRLQTLTDDELTLSGSFPSFLKDALPPIFLTDSNDYVHVSRHAAFPPPLGMKFRKVYFRPQIEAIKRRYDHVKEFSSSDATAEWVDSLDNERLVIMKDVERWELWEQKGNLARLNARPGPAKGRRPQQNGTPHTQGPSPLPKDANGTSERRTSPGDHASPMPWIPAIQPPVLVQHPEANGLASPLAIQPRAHRNFEEIQAARAARRAEIERRSVLLHPPIRPQLLEYMESFRAACQITTPLDDAQWDFLKARLETERFEAEEKLSRQSRIVQPSKPAPPSAAKMQTEHHPPREPEPKPGDPGFKLATAEEEEPKGEIDILDVEIDPNASSLHKRLAHFADQITIGKWRNGRSLSKASCAQFAAEVMLQVRKNYYDETFGGQHAIDPSLPRILTLENMRWVYENRVKPLTEQFQKDIFLCNGCENNTKGYGFEAVIQHYAAKHTSTLSFGSVVVHWKAEWPEKPPFHPNPMLVKALAITSSTSESAGHSTNHDEPRSNLPIMPLFQDVHSTESPLGYSNEAPNQVNGAFAGPGYAPAGYPLQPEYTPQTFSAPPPPPPAIITYPGAPQPVHPPYSANSVYSNASAISPYQATPPGGIPYAISSPSDPNVPTAETYRKHLVEMARFARELWFATAGVKGLPGTARTQIIIHHACDRFVASFHLQPGVAMFLDGLNHEAAMRPLRSLNGFSCRACATGQPGSLPVSERKQSTLPHLLGHFRTAHAEQPGLDWRTDMVQLPQLNTISDLVNAAGMDDTKLELLASAFPGAFPTPLPSLASLQTKPPPTLSSANKKSRIVPQGAYQTRPVGSPTKALGYSGIIAPPPFAERAGGTGSPAEDEYDPRRPSYLGHIVQHNPASIHGLPTHHDFYTSTPNGVSRGLELARKQEVGDADRFLEDLRPHLEAGQMDTQQFGSSSAIFDRQADSYHRSHDNSVAHGRNHHHLAQEDHYYSESVGHPNKQVTERYVTRYYEPATRVGYAPEAPVVYVRRQPDGTLLDDDGKIIYGHEHTVREPAYEYVSDGQRERYYAQETVPAYREDSQAYYPAAAREIVYVDRRAPQGRNDGPSYDPNAPQLSDEYRQEPLYGDGGAYGR